MFSKTSYRWQNITFLTYIFLLCIIISKHEPWFDEAQAWLLARDSSLYNLFWGLMRYEGSPGLWHLLLVIPAKSGLPYSALNIISGILASASVYLFIYHSPFPAYIKVLYPFSYFAFYQYAVVARSYVLLSVVLFGAAITYATRLKRPYSFTFIMILLANVSVHGMIMAIGIMLACFFDFLRGVSSLRKADTLKNITGYAVFGLCLILLVFQLKPPDDIITVASFDKHINNFFSRALAILSDSLTTNISAPTEDRSFFHILSYIIFYFTFLLTVYWYIIQRKLVTFLFPLLGLGILFTAVYANVWHQGTVFLLWMFVNWISLNSNNEYSKSAEVLRPLIAVSISAALIIQICWSFNASINDYKYNYSAAKEVAQYIKSNKLEDKKIYMTGFHSISVLPYFKTSIFCNYNYKQPHSFWLWSFKNNVYKEPYLNLSVYKPDFILMGVKNFCTERVSLDLSYLPAVPGYKAIKFFNGHIYWKERPYETDSFALFEKIH